MNKLLMVGVLIIFLFVGLDFRAAIATSCTHEIDCATNPTEKHCCTDHVCHKCCNDSQCSIAEVCSDIIYECVECNCFNSSDSQTQCEACLHVCIDFDGFVGECGWEDATCRCIAIDTSCATDSDCSSNPFSKMCCSGVCLRCCDDSDCPPGQECDLAWGCVPASTPTSTPAPAAPKAPTAPTRPASAPVAAPRR